MIVNADQTALFLEMPQERIVDHKGIKTVHVHTTGYEKERVTVMLACTATGAKLLAYIIFKRKHPLKIPVPNNVVIRAHPKGWMDERLVQDWITKVLALHVKPPPGRLRPPSMLVLDYYRGHLTEGMKQTMRLFKIMPAVIPGGCISVLQPLDVCINRSFKAGVRMEYNEWFSRVSINTFTRTGNLKKPPPEVVMRWVGKSWAVVPCELIQKSFKVCGISNALDASEDHLILHQLKEQAPDEVDVSDWGPSVLMGTTAPCAMRQRRMKSSPKMTSCPRKMPVKQTSGAWTTTHSATVIVLMLRC
ncbi:hypothetical protein CLOM_g17346 [Closterium sp. NIES-68]|nr:hypothetical protein CLOM_g17346 [Closterium sp. NIES-68]GJP62150.1 hypothetical protein CLOP_g19243 [Closterium sp. NIES-67]